MVKTCHEGRGIPEWVVASESYRNWVDGRICWPNLGKIWVFPKIGVPPKSSILIGFSIINHPFWGTPFFGNTHMIQIWWGSASFNTGWGFLPPPSDVRNPLRFLFFLLGSWLTWFASWIWLFKQIPLHFSGFWRAMDYQCTRYYHLYQNPCDHNSSWWRLERFASQPIPCLE